MGKTKELFMEMREQINAEVDRVLDGEVNPFELGRELSYTKNCIESAKEKIDAEEKKELSKYTKEELLNIGVKLAGGGYTYKFDHIPEWVKLNEQIKNIEEQAKAAFQQAVKFNTDTVTNDGEVITPANAVPRKQSVSYK